MSTSKDFVGRIEHLESRTLLAATTLRIDAGGDGFVESTGKTWAADRGFTAGTAATEGGDVAGTTSDGLFNSRRFGDFSYSLPIANGTYRVKLLLMDPSFSSSGRRKFDVFAEKQLKLNDFDIAAAAGGMNIAITKSFNTTVSDGRLNLWFDSVLQNAIISAIEVTPATSSTAITFKEIAAAPLGKFESMGDVIDGKLYVFGGYFSAQTKTTGQVAVYDPATNQWTTRGNMPENLTHSGTASDGQYIYLAGGFLGDWLGASTPGSHHVWRYNTVNDSWQRMLNLPVDRAAGGLVRVGRRLHFFGGIDRNKRDRGEHWVLDLRNPTVWHNDVALPNPRDHLGYIETGGKIYAIGGQHDLNEDTGNETAVHAFDVVTSTWSTVASLPKPISHTHNSTFVMNGKVISVGGSTTGMTSIKDVLQYDPQADKWTTIAQLPEPISATVADLINGKIIVTGGVTEGSQPKIDSWIQV